MKPVQQVVALGFPLIKYFLNIDTSYHQTVLKVLVLYKHCAQIREDQAYLITYSFISCGMFSNTLVDRRLIRFCLHQLCKDTHVLLVSFLSTLKRGKSLAQVYRKEGMCCKCVIVRLTYMLLIYICGDAFIPSRNSSIAFTCPSKLWMAAVSFAMKSLLSLSAASSMHVRTIGVFSLRKELL